MFGFSFFALKQRRCCIFSNVWSNFDFEELLGQSKSLNSGIRLNEMDLDVLLPH